MPRLKLLDANVVLRVLLQETSRPNYSNCVNYTVAGGLLRDYVIPEIIYQFIGHIRQMNAMQYAEGRGELSAYLACPKEYTRKHVPPSNWRKVAYAKFNAAVSQLQTEYPHVEIENKPFFDVALKIAIETGYDWVDCMLIAEHRVNSADVSSVDKNVLSGLALGTYKVSSSQVNKLTL